MHAIEEKAVEICKVLRNLGHKISRDDRVEVIPEIDDFLEELTHRGFQRRRWRVDNADMLSNRNENVQATVIVEIGQRGAK